MITQSFPGAKWWKFDFHTHTPASSDFMEGCSDEDKEKITPEFWLEKFIDKGIDCVAITDHNSGAWIDTLKSANDKLEEKLHLFPSVEISVNDGVHILAIFDPSKSTSDIDTLLGAVDYKGTRGGSDDVTKKSVTEVIDIIIDHGGVAIPAHANKEKGLFASQGNTLKQVLNNKNIHAIELCNKNIHAIELCNETYEKPQLYQEQKIQWSEVLGSDTHNFRQPSFGNFTWIKMENPTIEGLRLALTDGEASVNREMTKDLNRHAELIIESFQINKAKYIGRKELLECEFSPFLNTVIGGRGSGKSTLLEFMRFVFRRDKELPEAIRSEFDKYFQVGGDNLLTNESRLSLVYQKQGSRYRLNWSANAELPSLEVVDENGDWQPTDGEISSLFPVQIYSQKQIFELSKNPQSLLEIIDKDSQVKFSEFEKRRIALTHQYKQIRQKIGEIKEQISQKDKLTGELNDLDRQIKKIEESGHKDILQTFRHRQRQLASIERLEEEWETASEKLTAIVVKITPTDLDNEVFAPQDELTSAIESQQQRWQAMANRVAAIAEEAETTNQRWQQQKDTAQWQQDINTEVRQYEQIKVQLEQQGIDPEKYPMLLQMQTIKKDQLLQMNRYQAELTQLNEKSEKIQDDIQSNRRQLTTDRQEFLDSVLQDNTDIKIKVLPYGEDKKSLEQKVRQILQCSDKYNKDIEVLMEMNDHKDLKNKVKEIYQDSSIAKHQRFYQHLHNLPQESLSDFVLWHPQDNLKITFGKDQDLKTGSAGQKCAALLAFILSYGDEPLLLDQPEDDLDNELIYDLIVKQIRATKNKRQIIIVTHNANIVVNGNAEMVVPMTVGGGQSYIEKQASIQNNDIRKKICKVLEGGQKAFSQRYKRIHLEDDNV